jgi:hypothetical protein
VLDLPGPSSGSTVIGVVYNSYKTTFCSAAYVEELVGFFRIDSICAANRIVV